MSVSVALRATMRKKKKSHTLYEGIDMGLEIPRRLKFLGNLQKKSFDAVFGGPVWFVSPVTALSVNPWDPHRFGVWSEVIFGYAKLTFTPQKLTQHG